MSLVQPATLATRLGVSATDAKLPGAISVAEAMIAEWIGARTLAQESWTEKVRPKRDRDTLEISHGPLTGLTSISVDGTTQDVADFNLGYWGITVDDLDYRWSSNKTVSLTYVSGWANEAALPPSLLEAIIIQSGQAFTLDPTGRQKISEAVGDYSVSWQASPDATSLSPLSFSVTSLINRYRRPQL
jgi:hypothetical protein